MHWGRLLACPNEWFPAPMGVNLPQWGLTVGGFLPRWRGWSREGSAVGLAAGGPGHQARLVGPVAGNGAARGSCGRADGGPGQPTAPLGAPGEGNAAALVCPSDTERAVPVHQDPRSTVEPPCPRAPEPGGAITGTRPRPATHRSNWAPQPPPPTHNRQQPHNRQQWDAPPPCPPPPRRQQDGNNGANAPPTPPRGSS